MNQPKTRHLQRRPSIRKASVQRLPYTRLNYMVFGLGVAIILVGYIFLSIGPWNSFWSLTAAPVFLFLGYLVVLPFALLYQDKQEKSASQKK